MRPRDPDRLCPDDGHILGVESAAIMGHTLKLVILEPGASPLDLDTLRTNVAERLAHEPRATQRIDRSGSDPRWVDATDFDIGYHVRRHSNPDAVLFDPHPDPPAARPGVTARQNIRGSPRQSGCPRQ